MGYILLSSYLYNLPDVIDVSTTKMKIEIYILILKYIILIPILHVSFRIKTKQKLYY